MAAYYNEHDRHKAAWLRELMKRDLIASGDVDERSIADVQPADLAGYTQCHFFAGIGVWSYALFNAGWADADPVWTGSCPCQPFSSAGKGEAFNDPRHLWPHWFRLIRECRPGVVFGEQTASPAGLAWLDLVSDDVEGAGYAIGASDLCAAGVGAPHIRQRLYFVADANVTERERPDGTRSHAGADRRNNARWGREVGILAESEGEQHDGSGDQGRGRRELADRRTARVMANTTGWHPEYRELQPGGEHGLRAPDRCGDGTARDQERAEGFWSNADWLPCADGKARPVEPGTFPLAHGAPARVVRLRGYGDAIVAPQATAFIEAYLDVRGGL